MTDAPERIWADRPDIFDGMGIWHEENYGPGVEYIRADLAAAKAEVERLKSYLDDIQSGRGMFGVDAAVDLNWAVNYARAALQPTTQAREGEG